MVTCRALEGSFGVDNRRVSCTRAPPRWTPPSRHRHRCRAAPGSIPPVLGSINRGDQLCDPGCHRPPAMQRKTEQNTRAADDQVQVRTPARPGPGATTNAADQSPTQDTDRHAAVQQKTRRTPAPSRLPRQGLRRTSFTPAGLGTRAWAWRSSRQAGTGGFAGRDWT